MIASLSDFFQSNHLSLSLLPSSPVTLDINPDSLLMQDHQPLGLNDLLHSGEPTQAVGFDICSQDVPICQELLEELGGETKVELVAPQFFAVLLLEPEANLTDAEWAVIANQSTEWEAPVNQSIDPTPSESNEAEANPESSPS
jgi:hypothetical protein